MTVIAVLNSKGGSGKSTLATNFVSWLALRGEQVMLGDMDRQQSVRAWLQQRPPQLPAVTTRTRDDNKVFRAPPGTTHVVLDTPGALYDHQLARLLVWVDAVIVPVGPSLFDLDTYTSFMVSLRQVPRVRSQRCAVIAVGMRWAAGQTERARDEAAARGLNLMTVIEEHPAYLLACQQGCGIFDLPRQEVPERCLLQWEPVFQWIDLQARRQQLHRQTRATGHLGQAVHGTTASANPVGAQAPLSKAAAPSLLAAIAPPGGLAPARAAPALATAQPTGQATAVATTAPANDQPAPRAVATQQPAPQQPQPHQHQQDETRAWWQKLGWSRRP